jgi:hypothetical protein
LVYLGYSTYLTYQNTQRNNEAINGCETIKKLIDVHDYQRLEPIITASIDPQFHYTKGTQDSINIAIQCLFIDMMRTGQLIDIDKFYTAFYNLEYLSATNRTFLVFLNAIDKANRLFDETSMYRTRKSRNIYDDQERWRDVLNLDLKVDSIIAPYIQTKRLGKLIKIDTRQIFKLIASDVNNYITTILSFEGTRDIEPLLIYCESKISQFKSPELRNSLIPSMVKIKKAQEIYRQ